MSSREIDDSTTADGRGINIPVEEPPEDHEEFKDVENKYEKYFKENLE